MERGRTSYFLVGSSASVGAINTEWRHCLYHVSHAPNLAAELDTDSLTRYEKTMEFLDVVDPQKRYI